MGMGWVRVQVWVCLYATRTGTRTRTRPRIQTHFEHTHFIPIFARFLNPIPAFARFLKSIPATNGGFGAGFSGLDETSIPKWDIIKITSWVKVGMN